MIRVTLTSYLLDSMRSAWLGRRASRVCYGAFFRRIIAPWHLSVHRGKIIGIRFTMLTSRSSAPRLSTSARAIRDGERPQRTPLGHRLDFFNEGLEREGESTSEWHLHESCLF